MAADAVKATVDRVAILDEVAITGVVRFAPIVLAAVASVGNGECLVSRAGRRSWETNRIILSSLHMSRVFIFMYMRACVCVCEWVGALVHAGREARLTRARISVAGNVDLLVWDSAVARFDGGDAVGADAPSLRGLHATVAVCGALGPGVPLTPHCRKRHCCHRYYD